MECSPDKNCRRSMRMWNAKWGAPWGRRALVSPLDWGRSEKLLDYVDRLPWRLRVPLLRSAQMNRVRGPFAFQSNTSTRRFEYPWAFQRDRGARPFKNPGGRRCALWFSVRTCQKRAEVHNVDPFFDYGEGEAGYMMSIPSRNMRRSIEVSGPTSHSTARPCLRRMSPDSSPPYCAYRLSSTSLNRTSLRH